MEIIEPVHENPRKNPDDTHYLAVGTAGVIIGGIIVYMAYDYLKGKVVEVAASKISGAIKGLIPAPKPIPPQPSPNPSPSANERPDYGGASICVVASYDDKSPVAGAKIALKKPRFENDTDGEKVAEAVTDADGKAKIVVSPSLLPSDFVIEGFAEGGMPQVLKQPMGKIEVSPNCYIVNFRYGFGV